MHLTIFNKTVLPADTMLAELKTGLKKQIDDAAEGIRLQYITAGAGQAMAYSRKEQEARDFMADNEVIGPHIVAESIRLGLTHYQTAQLFLNLADLWAQASTAIEDTRLRAKDAVDAATTASDALQARRAVVWPV
jgi:hypothetical protein